MNDRIAHLLKVKDVTASKFAEMIGVQPSNISHILSGRNKPSIDFVIKLIEAFPDISIEWIVIGKEPMYNIILDEESENDEDNNSIICNQNDMQISDNEDVPNLFSEINDEINQINETKIDNESNYSKNKDLTEEDFILLDNSEDKKNSEQYSDIDNEIEEENSTILELENKDKEKIKTINNNNNNKPQRIIFIYDDNTFEILENR